MKGRNVFALGALLLVSGLMAACDKGMAPTPPQPAVTVVTMEAEPVTLTRELPGRTNPYRVAEVRPQVDGIVEERLFTEGGFVEAGDPLYRLDDAMYRADYNNAKAGLERAEAARDIAKLNADRISRLVGNGAVSEQEHDSAVATLRQAEAEVAVARAALDRAKVSLDYASIEAPIGGRIGRSTVTQGALVTGNQTEELAVVQQLDPIYVDLRHSVSEQLQLRKSLSRDSLEQPEDLTVTILLDDGSAYEYEGKLAFSEVSVDPTTGSNLLRVVVPNPEHFLMPGMYVRAVISQGVRENAILVPQQGIARDPRGDTSALVLNGDGEVEQRPVAVSRTVGDKWLVEKGLAPGDRVIVEGVQKVRPGDSVPESHVSEFPESRHSRSEVADASSQAAASYH